MSPSEERRVPDATTAWLSLLLTIAMTTSGAAANVAGPWRITARFDEASRQKDVPASVELVCAFTQHDDALSGDCRPADGGDGVPLRGTTHGDAVEWSFDIGLNEADRKERVTFTGTIAGDGVSMGGSFAITDHRGTFMARRE
jgi:hypothetical protein